MKIGIRTKLILLLAVVAMLPLVAGLFTLIYEGRRLRLSMVGQGVLLAAATDGRELQTYLFKDIEMIYIALHEAPVLADLEQLDVLMDPEKLRALDEAWPQLSEMTPEVDAVLSHPISDVLRLLRGKGDKFLELLVTDRFGQLVAASGKTTDFDQADETWWGTTYADGGGRIFILPVRYDRSVGAWCISICMPLATRDGQIVGVAKAVMGIEGWLGPTTRSVGRADADVTVVRPDGRIIHAEDVEPLSATVTNWRQPTDVDHSSGWFVTDDHLIRAFSTINLPDEFQGRPVTAPTWALVLSTPEGEAMGLVYRLTLNALGVGLGIIAALFLAGYYLIDRTVLRRIRVLERATRQVAQGDLGHRIHDRASDKGLTGRDEIDELTDDFNRMVSEVQLSQGALEEANELKTNFIQIAGHELRTPVSYILGVVKLLADSTDPDRLREAMKRMGDKAHRLNSIIQAMFKLMPEQRYGEQMTYGEVDLSRVVANVFLDCKPFADGRRQRLIVEQVDHLPTLQGDRDKLRDVIENLVMNGIKFTKDGGEIRVRLGRQLGDKVSIRVIDQGPGIADADLPHLFQPFFSTGDVMKHSSGSSGYQKRGMGLGLAIVRHFTRLHAGEVHVATGPDGSTFTVTIPIEPPSRDARPKKPEQRSDEPAE
jgi:signal transduction histidine kinase